MKKLSYIIIALAATINVKAQDIVINDAQPFSRDADSAPCSVKYVRTFLNTSWQALYIPFELPYSVWSEKAEIAYLDNVYSYDDDNDGTTDRIAVKFEILPEGKSVKANTPYLIKPKVTGKSEFYCTNTVIKATPINDRSISCNTSLKKYTFAGTYQPKNDMYSTGAYALKDGAFVQAATADQTLSPFRIYLTITDSDDYGSETNQNGFLHIYFEDKDLSGEDESVDRK